MSLAAEDTHYRRLLPAASSEAAAQVLTREGVEWAWAGLRGYAEAVRQLVGEAPVHFFDAQNRQVAEWSAREGLSIFQNPLQWGDKTQGGLVRLTQLRKFRPEAVASSLEP